MRICIIFSLKEIHKNEVRKKNNNEHLNFLENIVVLQLFKKFTRKLGIDKAVFYTVVARFMQGAGGVISVLFVVQYLTKIEQGFYYTFASIVGIQIFFELGLSGIITQYVAHEAVHLTLNEDRYEGDKKYQSRLASLFHFCIKWYIRLAFILFVLLFIIGFVFFDKFYIATQPVEWKIPWLLLCIGATLNFLLIPFTAFIEGLNKVAEISKFRFVQQIVMMCTLWLGLGLGFNIYTGGIVSIIGAITLAILINRYFFSLLKNIFRLSIIEIVSYKKDIWPYQWKIALSWASGYFIFQLFNPVLFATEGAEVAGQMGITMTALNLILFLSLGWMSTKIPLFSGLIAKKEFVTLDKVFNKTLLISSFVNVILLSIMFLFIVVIRNVKIIPFINDLGNRLLPNLPILFLMVTIVLNQILSGWATYLRCHKKEPMLIQSVTMGFLCSLSLFWVTPRYGVVGMTFVYMLLTLFGFVWTLALYKTKKRMWHYGK